MKNINGQIVTEKEFACIKYQFNKFLETEVGCSHNCPMWDEDAQFNPVLKELKRRLDGDQMCICHMFTEFRKTSDHYCPCPCYVYGEDAFRRLAIVVKGFKS